jgi:hypothetical protein
MCNKSIVNVFLLLLALAVIQAQGKHDRQFGNRHNRNSGKCSQLNYEQSVPNLFCASSKPALCGWFTASPTATVSLRRPKFSTPTTFQLSPDSRDRQICSHSSDRLSWQTNEHRASPLSSSASLSRSSFRTHPEPFYFHLHNTCAYRRLFGMVWCCLYDQPREPKIHFLLTFRVFNMSSKAMHVPNPRPRQADVVVDSTMSCMKDSHWELVNVWRRLGMKMQFGQ